MTSESAGLDPYEVVLADLKAKRDQIDHAINAIESIRGKVTGGPASSGQSASQNAATGPGAFLGMTMVDAAKRLLANQRRPLGNAEILSGLKAGGLVMTSADPVNTIGSVLTRRFHDKGDIVRIGRGIWGLPEWYPNRSFKKKDDRSDSGDDQLAEAAE